MKHGIRISHIDDLKHGSTWKDKEVDTFRGFYEIQNTTVFERLLDPSLNAAELEFGTSSEEARLIRELRNALIK